MVESALAMAVEAHAGQKDKSGNIYILHVIRVWQGVRAITNSEDCHIVALLHDVVEDTHTTLEDIRTEFGERIMIAVDAITKRRGESLPDYIDRVAGDPIALRVKQADSWDNYNRLGALDNPEDVARLSRKYEYVFQRLGKPKK